MFCMVVQMSIRKAERGQCLWHVDAIFYNYHCQSGISRRGIQTLRFHSKLCVQLSKKKTTASKLFPLRLVCTRIGNLKIFRANSKMHDCEVAEVLYVIAAAYDLSAVD